ncbi:hypothetical protein ACFQW6_00080 [Nocardioides sp. GCM10028917]
MTSSPPVPGISDRSWARRCPPGTVVNVPDPRRASAYPDSRSTS